MSFIDAISLTMFIPLFQLVSENSKPNTDIIFINSILNFFNIELTLNTLLLLMLSFFSIKGVLKFFDIYIRGKYSAYLLKKVRLSFLDYLYKIKYKKYTEFDQGKIQNNLTSETNNIIFGYTQYIGMFQNIVNVLIFITMSFITNINFSLIIIIGGIFSRIIFTNWFKKSKELSTDVVEINNKYTSLLIQEITNYKYLKSTAKIKDYNIKVFNNLNELEKKQIDFSFLVAKINSFREPILIFFLVVAIYVQVNIFKGNLLSVIMSLLFFYKAFNSLMSVQSSWTGFLKYVGSLIQLDNFKKEFSKDLEVYSGEKLLSIEGSIALKDISLILGTQKVLDNINLEIKKNRSYAIVGKSGAGKTSLINILTTVLKPSKGELFINNTNIEEINLLSYRKLIGIITQETVVFNDTLFNNVTFWDEKNQENYQKFLHVIQRSHLDDFFEVNQKNENILLGDNGVILSGGQKQRLSIARELYKNVDVLIFDEATSALDSETEKNIQQSIQELKGKTTLISIAHRLSTIKESDYIIFLNKGKIEAIDSFENLFAQSTEFKKMVNLQAIN